ncbi:hypothetical protein [Geothrix sp. PMB-07]|uniref:hypothetical protein n=1 Tax=Geothrix sp. PMB-07 TaxID=3068640 RepID=UPI002741B17F|nr:hypothetical protein [Geothrix sp. PMB-07]WLT32849.1 hypothetical protein Q9293_05830 [Geothrix sp. PMB-07]
MRLRTWLAMGLMGPILLLVACGRAESRRAREVDLLVQVMAVELRTASEQATAAFSRRPDFEELRKSFGDDRFDTGIPLGPAFQTSLSTMIKDLEAQLAKEPRDVEFPRKAVRKVRQIHQWWDFVRKQLQTRRDQLAKGHREGQAQRLLGGRERGQDVVEVLDETIQVIQGFEAITQRCIRSLEEIITQS